jgi:hypothetical protein
VYSIENNTHIEAGVCVKLGRAVAKAAIAVDNPHLGIRAHKLGSQSKATANPQSCTFSGEGESKNAAAYFQKHRDRAMSVGREDCPWSSRPCKLTIDKPQNVRSRAHKVATIRNDDTDGRWAKQTSI